MSWKTNIGVIACFVIVSCNTKQPDEVSAEQLTPSAKHLIEVEQLKQVINHDSVLIIDMRKPEEFSQGHIAGAINLWRTDIQKNDWSIPG